MSLPDDARPRGAWESWQPDEVVARWVRAPRRLADDDSARPTWLALRQAACESRLFLSGTDLGPSAFFGVRVVVHGTARGPSSAISSSERIVDGVIAAFHTDVASAEVVGALTSRMKGIEPATVATALAHCAGPLFTAPAIKVTGKSVQISPADERCQVGEVADTSAGRPWRRTRTQRRTFHVAPWNAKPSASSRRDHRLGASERAVGWHPPPPVARGSPPRSVH